MHGLDACLPAHSYAFQPIVDISTRQVWSYEALVRGPAGEAAGSVFARVQDADKYRFDGNSRVTAVHLAAKLGLTSRLNLNALPGGLCEAGAVSQTLDAAAGAGIALDRLVLEVTEVEAIGDLRAFAKQICHFRSMGLELAIDDFGAGHSGLNLLAEFQPDQIKIDMVLARGIESDGPRQAIVRAIVQVCVDLGIDVVAEGVETVAEYRWFVDHGVSLFQGYLFGRPGFECLPLPDYSAIGGRTPGTTSNASSAPPDLVRSHETAIQRAALGSMP